MQKLCKCTGSLFLVGRATTLALFRNFLNLTLFFVLTPVRQVVSSVHAPMLFAQSTMLRLLVRLLGDGLMNCDHLVLAGVAEVCLTLLTRLFPLQRKSLLDLLEVIEQVTDALGHHVCLKFVLGLPSPGAHTKDMAHKISIFDGPDLFASLISSIALV